MPSYLIKYALRFGLILAIALVLGSSYPRHSRTRLAWGFPIEYRYEVRREHIIPGQEDKATGFAFVNLIANIWIIFLVIIFGWYAGGTIYILIRRYISLRT